MLRTGLQVRWAPTELMLADGLTKDQADPADLLRAALLHGSYQLSSEATVLAEKRLQRDLRARRQGSPKSLVGSNSSPNGTTPSLFRKAYYDHDTNSIHPPEESSSVKGRAVRFTTFDD